MDTPQDQVLSWAVFANEEEKVEFLKAFLNTLSPKELNVARNIVKRLRFYKKPKKSIDEDEKEQVVEGFPVSQIVALDVEKVELLKGHGVEKVKAAKIGLCTFRREKNLISIRHAPGTFVVNR